jgi:NMT1-like family
MSLGPIKSWLTRRHRRRSPSVPCGSCEQIGSTRLWPSVAEPTRTSAMEAKQPSSWSRRLWPRRNSKFRMFASVGTGETNGIYYPLDEVICGIVNQNLNQSGVRCSREMTPGSVYNVDALRSSELECADPIRRGLRRLSWDWRLFRGPVPGLRPVLALLQDKSPVLENLTVQRQRGAARARASGGPGSIQKAGALEVDLPPGNLPRLTFNPSSPP